MEKLNMKKKICFVTHSNPNFLGGVSLFHKNLIKYIKKEYKNLEITWIYFGAGNKKYSKGNINYLEIKSSKIEFLKNYINNLKLINIFKKNEFNIINYGGGFWTYFYKKKNNQEIVHPFHGTVYYFNKNHFKQFGWFKKILFSPLLPLSWISERPHKKMDKIICVSEKVKKQVEKLYGKRKNVVVIRTGVDLKNFKARNKIKVKEKLKLEKNKTYGLYVGGGGYWTKGLDRAINLSEELYKLNKKFRLLIIGPEYKKVKHLLNKKSVIYLQNVPREKMPKYYSASEMFFCMSRYEGGAPTLVVSEAMASGCLLVCSKDSKQEIVENMKNSIVIKKFNEEDAKKILNIYNNEKAKKRIIKHSMETIKNLSLDKWGKTYSGVLIK